MPFYFSFLLCDTHFNYDFTSSGFFTFWRPWWSYWWVYWFPSTTWLVIYMSNSRLIMLQLCKDRVWIIWRLSIVLRYNFNVCNVRDFISISIVFNGKLIYLLLYKNEKTVEPTQIDIHNPISYMLYKHESSLSLRIFFFCPLRKKNDISTSVDFFLLSKYPCLELCLANKPFF